MLQSALNAEFVPATNLKGELVGANWSFLLPNLELDRIVCLGAPRGTTLAALSRIGQNVVVIRPTQPGLRHVAQLTRRSRLPNVELLATGDRFALPMPERSVDLVVVADRVSVRQLRRNSALRADLRRVVKPGGLVYLEFVALVNRGWATIDGFCAPELFRLTPTFGEMQTAVPASDSTTLGYFDHQGLCLPSVKPRLLRLIGKLTHHARVSRKLLWRHGALFGRAPITPIAGPPHYLQSVAQHAGVHITNHRWGMSAPGDYRSRKVLFFLFDPAGEIPEYVVKITRDPTLNYRLENEYRALSWLHQRQLDDQQRLPKAAFFGYHGDLAILGETAICAVPFRDRTSATVDCPHARDAIDWMITLGAATANRSAATPYQVADGLDTLLDRFLSIYQLTAAHRGFLHSQIAAIACNEHPFPLVFQHGDPGTWNVLVGPRGRAVFLDWEAADPEGMPLWDLFYFLRSYALCVARKNGTRNSIRGVAQHFLEPSPLSRLLIESVRRYCEMTSLPGRLIEPLFYTCWMHRALKEATRLLPNRIEQGHYVSLLRLCIEHHRAPMLKGLFHCLRSQRA